MDKKDFKEDIPINPQSKANAMMALSKLVNKAREFKKNQSGTREQTTKKDKNENK